MSSDTKILKTTEFRFTCGVYPGYGGPQAGEKFDTFETAWQEEAEKVWLAGGLQISAVVQPARAVYPRLHGCPAIGELVFDVYGVRRDPGVVDGFWRAAVMAVCEGMRVRYKQTTAYLTFHEVDFIYLKGEPNGGGTASAGQ